MPDLSQWIVQMVVNQPHIKGSWYVENSDGDVVKDGFEYFEEALDYIIEHRDRFPDSYIWSLYVMQMSDFGDNNIYVHDFEDWRDAVDSIMGDRADYLIFRQGDPIGHVAYVYRDGQVFAPIDYDKERENA